MHRFAIGDPQGVRHQPFAELRIWMVDGEAVRLKLYPRGCGSFGLVGCGGCRWHREVRSGVHVEISLRHARGPGARFGHAQAIVRRGDPVQFQWWVRI